MGSRAGARGWVAAIAAVLVGCTGGREEVPYASDADRSFYPEGPYGLAEGDTIADYGFDTADGVLHLQDLRADRGNRLLVVFGVQTWPNACAAEADYLAGAYDDYRRRGIDVLGVLVEAFETEPTPDGARSYFEILHDAPYHYAADAPRRDPSFGADLERGGLDASPVNVIVDLDTMQITVAFVGWSRQELESHLYFAF